MKPEKIQVAVYKKSFYGKGYVRSGVSDLVNILTKHKEDNKIKAYRATKTKEHPKGDQTLKKKIRAFMPSGDYGEGISRSAKNILQIKSCLVQLDFDTKTSTEEIKRLFEEYTWVTVAGKSCGGEGFYLLVNTADAEHYNEYWQALVEFFKNTTKHEVDLAVSSINEIRYLSLTTDVLIRENATLWKVRKEKKVSSYLNASIPHDSALIKATKEIGLHYIDLIALSGLNNSNGVPVEAVKSYFKPSMFDKTSHLHQASDSEIAEIIDRIYIRYSDQHGESITPILPNHGEISLPPVQFNKKSSASYKAYLVVQNIFEVYLLKTDSKTKISYRYTGTYWEEIPEFALRNFLSVCANASRMDAELNELTDFRDLMLKQIQDLTSENFLAPLNKFNLSNGVLEFINGDVLFTEHSDKHLFTYVLDYEYDPEAVPNTLLKNFLTRTIPDADSLSTLFQYIGSAFITEYKIELFLILLGGGANGKSTLIDLLISCLGGAVGRYSLDKLTDPDGETSAKQARFIYNKVLGVSPEDSKIKDSRLWRKIASKEPIEVKALYKDTFETCNYARLISCMNEIPYLDTLQGSIRRLIVLGTGPSLRRDEYDLGLATKLNMERPAFLNLIIEGYKQAFKTYGNITLSESSIVNINAVLDEHDVVINFLRDKEMLPLIPYQASRKTNENAKEKFEKANPNILVFFITLSQLYQEFRDWSEDGGIKNILTKRLFSKRLIAMQGSRLDMVNGEFKEVIYLNNRVWFYGKKSEQL